MQKLSLDDLNKADIEFFIVSLGAIFEHSPWVAQQAFSAKPFASSIALHTSMCEVVAKAGTEAQLKLIRAHPDLAGKAARAGKLTQDSSKEQAGAGLDKLSDEEYTLFHRLNDAYKAKFDFPFILAVKGHTKESILASFDARLNNSNEAELAKALQEIYKIAGFRLEALLSSS